MKGFKAQIEDLPVYKNMGTNGKIPAGPPADLCRMAKNFQEGFMGGSLEGNTKAPTAPATKAPTLADGPWSLDKNAGVPLPAAAMASGETPAYSSAVAAAATPAYTSGGEEFVEATPASIEHAKVAKEQGKQAAKEAGAEEDKWTKQEATYAQKAKALNKVERNLQRAAAKANAKADTDIRDAVADATAKYAKANDADAASQAKYKKLQAKYAATQKAMQTEGKIAAVAAAKAAVAYKHEMEKLHDEIKQEKAKGTHIQKVMIANEKALAAKHKSIDAKYAARSSAVAATAKNDADTLTKEKNGMEADFANKFKTNAEKAAAHKAVIEAERVKNLEVAHKASESLERRAAAVKEEHDSANAAWVKKADTAAKTLVAMRAATAAKFAAKAAKEEGKYTDKMAKAAILQNKADEAHKMEQDAIKEAAKEQAAMDAERVHDDATDMEMKSCAMDGTECELPDGSCAPTDKNAKPGKLFLAADLVSCSKTPTAEQPMEGEAWTGLPPPAPLAPIAAPDQKCLALRATFKAGPFGFAMSEANPATEVACAQSKDAAAHKLALVDFFAMAAACPEHCIPGTATFTDDGVMDSHGVCITPEDFALMKEQIMSTPEYEDMGTGGRFKAGAVDKHICTTAKAFMAGIEAGH